MRSNDCPYGMGLWSPIITEPGSVRDFCADGDRYIQYTVILETENSFETPILNEVGFSWYQYQGQQSSEGVEFSLYLESNPAYSPVQFKVCSPVQQSAEIAVFSVEGRIVYQNNELLDEGTNLISTCKLQPGIYFCRMIVGEINASRRFVVIQ